MRAKNKFTTVARVYEDRRTSQCADLASCTCDKRGKICHRGVLRTTCHGDIHG